MEISAIALRQLLGCSGVYSPINAEDPMMKTSTLAALAVMTLGLAACSTTEERIGGAAVGAGTGAVVAGPVGAVVGGAAGAVTGPAVARTTRRATR